MVTTDLMAQQEATSAKLTPGRVVGHRAGAELPARGTVTTGSGGRWGGATGTSLVVLDGGLAVTSLLRP